MLTLLRFLGLPAAICAALLVFIYLDRRSKSSLDADLKRGATGSKSWQHFGLEAAYRLLALIIAGLIWLAIMWSLRQLQSPPPDQTRQEAMIMQVSSVAPVAKRRATCERSNALAGRARRSALFSTQRLRVDQRCV
jgi:hypothetical protein